jgi:hypothetical protein
MRVQTKRLFGYLANLYLNAPILLGFPTNDFPRHTYYTNAVTYSSKVIAGPIHLSPITPSFPG